MATLLADIRFALRVMRANLGFSLVAVAALALGIGANTAIFTVVSRVMLEPLPYPQPDQIMRLGRKYLNGNGYSNSIPKFMVWRNNHVFQSMALYDQQGIVFSFGSGDRPEQVKAMHVSSGFFPVFGVTPAQGRGFSAQEDAPDGPLAAVLSNDVWRNRLAADPHVLGRTLLLNGQPFTVTGVMPAGFQSNPPADVWLPLQADPNSTNQGHFLAAAARLKPGVDLSQARAEMKLVGEQFRRANPKWMDADESVAVVPMRDSLVDDVRLALYILLGAVGFVLLIACANVANLLLARAAARQKELAIRAAIGAGRWRVIRQLLTESVILAAFGAALGFLLGAWGVRALLALAPGDIPRLTQTDGVQQSLALMDWRVAAFTLAIALATAVLFGLFPAVRAANPDLASTLKEGGGRAGSAHGHHRVRSMLVVTEIALALVLLIGAALLIRTFAGLRSVNPGFDSHNVLAFETSMAGGNYNSTAKVAEFVEQVQRRLQAAPGVVSVASALMLPISGTDVDLPFNIVGAPPAKGLYNGDEQWRSVSPGYFQTLSIPLVRGRVFRPTDLANSPRVVLINQAMAKKYWPKTDPIGQVVVIGKGLGPQFDDPPREIVGVVGNVRETGLDAENECVMYIPQTQQPEGLTALANSVLPLAWAVRTASNPMTFQATVAREVRAVDSLIPVGHQRTTDQMISDSLTRRSFTMLVLAIFAAIALLLAAIGIYGLMSYTVEQRTQEIGIRVALGAGQAEVLRLIVGQGARLLAIGVVLGLAAAFGVTRLLSTMLFGIKAWDPVTFATVAALISLVALVATLVPARRAAALEASEALRHE